MVGKYPVILYISRTSFDLVTKQEVPSEHVWSISGKVNQLIMKYY